MTYPTVWIIDRVLELCRALLGEKVINRTDSIAVLVGGWGLYVVTALLALGMFILGAQTGSIEFILYAVAILPIGILLHWVAIKLLDTNERLIGSTPTAIRSDNFLNVVAVLLILVGVIGIPIAFVLGIIDAINGKYGTLVLLGQSMLALYIGILALNPERVNVRHSPEATIGQEAIGVMTFALKALYKAVPLFFGIFIVVAGIMSFVLLIQSITVQSATDTAAAAFGVVFALWAYAIAALSPVLGYILFLLLYVGIDVIRSILTLGAADKSEFASLDAAPGAAGGGRPAPRPAPKAEPRPKAAPKAAPKPAEEPAAPKRPPDDDATQVDR